MSGPERPPAPDIGTNELIDDYAVVARSRAVIAASRALLRGTVPSTFLGASPRARADEDRDADSAAGRPENAPDAKT